MNPQWRQRTQKSFQWAVVVATIAILFRVGKQHGSDLSAIDLQLDLFWLINAAVATAAANLLLPLAWRDLVASFGHIVATGRCVRLWCFAQTARYLPTGLVAVASRLQLAAKEGISKTVTVSSIAIETAALLCWAVLICSVFVPSTTLPDAARWAGGGTAALALLSAPSLVRYATRRLSRLNRVEIPASDSLLVAKGLMLLGASVATRAVGTICLAAGFLHVDSGDIPLVIGAAYAAVVAGMIGVTPAGLGVREGVMAAILAKQFGLADAAAFALMTRAWEFASEMLFLAVASWWGRNRQMRQTPDMNSSQLGDRL